MPTHLYRKQNIIKLQLIIMIIIIFPIFLTFQCKYLELLCGRYTKQIVESEYPFGQHFCNLFLVVVCGWSIHCYGH